MNKFKIRKLLWYIELLPKLGIANVFYVLYYRLLLRSGLGKRKFPIIYINSDEPVFYKCPVRENYPAEWKDDLLKKADLIRKGEIPYYSYHRIKQSQPPDWFLNPFNGVKCKETNKHWTEISDFNDELGDIKNLWEASRFSWLGILSRAYAVSGNEIYLDTLNRWLNDWLLKNPVNMGPNWKCGQEASIRVLNLLNTAYILRQDKQPSKLLINIIIRHLDRIALNIRYALAQRNNHATSEAAALFIAASWLAIVDSTNESQYNISAIKGRKYLEHLLRSLVYEDGSFAQHSVNYHRLFLDTISLVNLWVCKLDLEPLSTEFNEIAKKSTAWILSIVDESGTCPNLGANDGTLLLGNHPCNYINYRPSLQLASVMISGNRAFENGPWDEALYWFDIDPDDFSLFPPVKSSVVHSSGLVVMKGKNSWALLRYPFFRFRPTHNDVFHFDLWAKGKNLLFDSGTFSYNSGKVSRAPDLKSVHAHNTLSFDSQEQMPYLGRFLFGKWVKPLKVGEIMHTTDKSCRWEGSYKDFRGNFHVRRIDWNDNQWTITDSFRGPSKNVEIGFNFERCNYKIDDRNNALLLPWGEIKCSTGAKMENKEHLVSRYYMQLLKVNRLVVASKNNSEIVTKIKVY